MHHFHTKLKHQKPMLRQIEWWVQTGPITKNGVFPETTSFFGRFCFSLRASYKKLIWCTNDSDAHICTFCKRWSFIWRWFSPVSIPKIYFTFLPNKIFFHFSKKAICHRCILRVCKILQSRFFLKNCIWLLPIVTAQSERTEHSFLQGISPTLKYWPHPFLPSHP